MGPRAFMGMVEAPEVWYHGRTTQSTAFDLERTGQGNDQEGPGFYFTSDLADARGYAWPDGIVITAELTPRRLVSTASRAHITDLIKAAPELEMKLADWDENPDAAMRAAVASCVEDEYPYQQVWVSFYRYNPAEYLREMVKLGFDGHEATWLTSGVRHMIVYNPACIKVLSMERHTS